MHVGNTYINISMSSLNDGKISCFFSMKPPKSKKSIPFTLLLRRLVAFGKQYHQLFTKKKKGFFCLSHAFS